MSSELLLQGTETFRQASPRLSVALATRNRPKSLERTLKSLKAQEQQPYEVIVSDDSNTSFSSDVQDLCREYGHLYSPGPQRGLYANRNAAALKCSGTHIRTMDDDLEFPPDHIAQCLRALEEDPGSIWIISECSPHEAKSGPVLKCPPQLNPRGFSDPPTGNGIWAIADGASIFPRRIFDLGNRYFEGFLFGASYLEFGSRLHWLGFNIRHLQGTFVIHHYDSLTRSIDNETDYAASRLFAALCHSFIYQRTLKNQLLTSMETLWRMANKPFQGAQALNRARAAFSEHKRSLRDVRNSN